MIFIKVKLVTVVVGDQKAPFLIATTQNCSEALFHFNLDTYLISLSVKQGVVKYHFQSLWYDQVLNPGLVYWVECLPMVQETLVQSQVASYQKLLKWYLIPPCLTLSNIMYVSRVKWAIQGKELGLPLHLGVVAIEMGAFWLHSRLLYLTFDLSNLYLFK